MIDTNKARAEAQAETLEQPHMAVVDLCDDLDAERAKVARLRAVLVSARSVVDWGASFTLADIDRALVETAPTVLP